MKQKHKDLIIRNLVELTDEIELEQALWNCMLAAGILTTAQKNKIELNNTREEQVSKLLEFLRRRDDDVFGKFCKCLRDTDQDHVVNKYLDDSPDSVASKTSETDDEPQIKKRRSEDALTNFSPERKLPRQTDGISEEVDDIDLNDGPHLVRVERCTKHFYEEHHKGAYPMSRSSRGYAIIISITHVAGLAPRTGTDIDCKKLQELFKQLQFGCVTVYTDEDGLTSQDIKQKIQSFLMGIPKSAQSCAVCMLTHGEDGKLMGTDGTSVEVHTIINMFHEKQTPNLAGKPKMLVLQACRGGAADSGEKYSEDESDGLHPSVSDLVICYPTLQGYRSWRNLKRGSWYIAALVEVFEKHACRYSISQLLTRVNARVSKNTTHYTGQEDYDKKKETPEFVSRLRKDWYFFPGYSQDEI